MTGAASVFALVVVLILANPPNAHALLFGGGMRDGLFGLAMVALAPLISVVQIGLGTALAHRFASVAALREPWLLWLCGSGLLSLIGVAIAAAGFVNPWVCGSMLILGVACAVASGACTDVLNRLIAWTRLEDVASSKPAFAVVRLGIVAALVLIGLRAATGELNDTDVVQFYWGWLNEVRHLGGIHLSPALPMVQDFTAGRGNGAYLLLAGIAPGLVSHVVSAAYCAMFAVVLRAFVLRIAADASSPLRPPLLLAAEVVCLASLWMIPGSVAFGKYHLQFAAWALGFLLACLQIASEDVRAARTWRLMLLPVAVAIPIGLAQFEAFIALVVIVAVAAAPHRWLATRRLLPLLIVGCASAALALLANWLFLGIPDLNPFPLFERFIAEQRFGLWTSRLQQYYINYIGGGVLTLNAGNSVGKLRELRSLASDIRADLIPIILGFTGLAVAAITASIPMRRSWRQGLSLVLGAALGYGLYRTSLLVTFSDLALSPALNRVVLYAMAAVAYLLAVRSFRVAASRPFLYGLLSYWLICAGFILVFHSGSMDRLMRHADVVGVALVLVALVCLVGRLTAFALPIRATEEMWGFRLRASAAVPILLVVGVAFSVRAAVSTAAVDPPRHLLASALGLQGRAVGLTNPMAKFERCYEIARSVPADTRVLFLNAYTAMAYCNNAVLLPRTMIVTPHASEFARDLATSAFADADTVEQTMRHLHIDYFLVLKGDFEFWASGLSAPFRPGELERRFDLLTETPSFYVLTWRGRGRAIPAETLATIAERRRFGIQQSGFMARNEFVSQWRAMANLGADRPKYQLGARLDFSSSGWSALYADHGWYAAEPHGTWTVGPVAVLKLPLARPAPGPLRVTMEVMPFLIPQLPSRTVRVKQGAVDVATWAFQLGEGYQAKTIDLPAGAGMDPQGIVLTFEIENSVSQYALGLNADWRPLGMAVRSLKIEAVVLN
ncbi:MULTISPECIES: hypothetical protein [Bradyrhizobium]|uniref:hypothetical protein n=2 Tax=Nitrobacteraceae TaxID=41294 RepID=UPI0003FE78DA|nr:MULTISPECIES: hypothetical protein [Bradyrhizobium]WLB91467.1 hypothetical protein QIH91_14365 [Bradyrhizobium japonicum USDA 135]GLR92700.1 hypothetical protein GCM10007858_03220 [Bradyrhizobium liaoningense]